MYQFFSSRLGFISTVLIVVLWCVVAIQYMHAHQLKMQCKGAMLKATIDAYTRANKISAEKQIIADRVSMESSENSMAALKGIISVRDDTIKRLQNVKRDQAIIDADCRIDDRIVRDANRQFNRTRSD
ncbi:MAG: hypothetical protein E6Q97_20370 [Desulfurellales bacterium]|nr:MAG: hypothetical protein E6Q97_20370 [Desulfurellales bacterium]